MLSVALPRFRHTSQSDEASYAGSACVSPPAQAGRPVSWNKDLGRSPRVPSHSEVVAASSHTNHVQVAPLGTVTLGAPTFSSTVRAASPVRSSAPPPSQPLQTCTCGNFFLPDSEFCRRCGSKRPKYVQSPGVPTGSSTRLDGGLMCLC